MACLHTGNLDPESQFQSKQWKQSKIKIYNKVNSSNHSIKGINIKHKYINILNVYACIDINHFVFFLQHQLLELNTIKCYFYFSSSQIFLIQKLKFSKYLNVYFVLCIVLGTPNGFRIEHLIFTLISPLKKQKQIDVLF